MLVDSHAHLDDPRFENDREVVLERAWTAGVRAILTIGNGAGPDDMGCGIPLAEKYDWVYTSVGIHPHDAAQVEPRHFSLMEQLAATPRVVAVGETGLDYYYDNSPREVQRQVFREQLDLAARVGRPVIIHTRAADADTIQILKEKKPPRGVLHCFTGGEALADCALELGLMISFSGILTFNSAESIRRVAMRMPAENILVETDCPYLAPVPYRGRRNEPSFLPATAERLAAIRGMTLEQIGTETSRNFHGLFEIA